MIIDFIYKHQKKNMPSPSYRDMAKHIGVKTTNSIHKYLYRPMITSMSIYDMGPISSNILLKKIKKKKRPIYIYIYIYL